MLGLAKKTRAPEFIPSLVAMPPKPTPRQITTTADEIGAYEALAKELNFNPAKLFEEQLLRFLAAEGIQIYDDGAVDKYLAAHAEKDRKVWIWRPLREQDKPQGWVWSGRAPSFDENRARLGHGGYQAEWGYRPYDKAVPIHILRNVKKIHDRFGSQALFFVSDYAVPNPDPFIMVTALDVKRIIFGVWDEPGFGTE